MSRICQSVVRILQFIVLGNVRRCLRREGVNERGVELISTKPQRATIEGEGRLVAQTLAFKLLHTKLLL